MHITQSLSFRSAAVLGTVVAGTSLVNHVRGHENWFYKTGTTILDLYKESRATADAKKIEHTATASNHVNVVKEIKLASDPLQAAPPKIPPGSVGYLKQFREEHYSNFLVFAEDSGKFIYQGHSGQLSQKAYQEIWDTNYMNCESGTEISYTDRYPPVLVTGTKDSTVCKRFTEALIRDLVKDVAEATPEQTLKDRNITKGLRVGIHEFQPKALSSVQTGKNESLYNMSSQARTAINTDNFVVCDLHPFNSYRYGVLYNTQKEGDCVKLYLEEQERQLEIVRTAEWRDLRSRG